MAINRINNFYFVQFQRVGGGVPELLKQSLERIQRPGVNGTAFTREGVKGQPFQMESGVDLQTRGQAEDLRFLYLYLQQGNQKVDLVVNSVDYASFHGVRYVVEDVSNFMIRRLGAAVGGLSYPSYYYLTATWTLTPVKA